nr:hypothetical protein [Tanacetum cinerariifolium]
SADILTFMLHDAADNSIVTLRSSKGQHFRDEVAPFVAARPDLLQLLEDGRITIDNLPLLKMSKSYGNIIDIFVPEKELLKTVRSIISDSTPLEAPKNPDTDVTFKLYSLLASPEQTAALRTNYLAGGYGYGHAKTALYELILQRFAEERRLFNYYMDNLPELDARLAEGARKAQDYGAGVLAKVREKVGYGG